MAKILIVDDSAFMRGIIKDIVLNSGHTVVGEGMNVKEAIVKNKELKPDIIFMDITMSDINGIEGVKRIVAIDKNVKIIMCSAMGQESMILESIKAGASDFIVKPFKKEVIGKVINKVISRPHFSQTYG